MIMSTRNATPSSPTSTSSLSPSMSLPAPATASAESLGKKHIIYRGLNKKSMEYMSLAHTNKHPDAAHTLQGEILLSGVERSGYIQYCITLDQEWMTRRVVLTAMFDSGSEKRLVLEVDRDQRWHRVTEHRLVRSRSFFRGGMDSPARMAASSPRLSGLGRSGSGMDARDSSVRAGRTSSDSMQEADTSYFADDASCCSASSFSSSSSDQESTCSIPFEKINLTWSPPPKGSSKRGSKRFSSVNPLRDMAPTLSAAGSTVSTLPFDFLSVPPNKSCTTPSIPSSTTIPTTTATITTTTTTTTAFIGSASPTQPFSPIPPPSTPTAGMTHEAYFPSSSGAPSTPGSARHNIGSLRSPVNEFTHRTLSKSSSSSSPVGSGPKTYEHLPALDGCIHLDLGGDISPSTLLLPLRRATLGIDPENMDEHLESLISCPSAVTSEMSAVVSFPDLDLRPVRTHVAYVGQGSGPSQSVVERWTDEDDDEAESTLVEVDSDGLVIQYSDEWARLNVC